MTEPSRRGGRPIPEPLEIAAWHLALNELSSDDLPGLGVDALVCGLDTPSLRLLAGQTKHDSPLDSRDLFIATLTEMGIDVLEPEDAAWRLIRLTASQIVAGEIDPIIGSDYIWRHSFVVEPNGDLRIFAGLSSELDDDEARRPAIATQVVAAARDFLDRPSPRRWLRLMASASQEPLEWTDSDIQDNSHVELSRLEVTTELAGAVEKWNADYRSTLTGWPQQGGFVSAQAAESFVAEGRSLVTRLQHELGENFVVEYMPEPIRQPSLKIQGNRRRLRRASKRD